MRRMADTLYRRAYIFSRLARAKIRRANIRERNLKRRNATRVG